MAKGLHIVLAAGGTGGHMMPADVLAAELRTRGHQVSFVTDDRGARLPDLFEQGDRLVLQARPNAGLVGRLKFYSGLIAGIFQVRKQFRSWTPDLVIGFGGYPSAPAMIAARMLGLPTLLHEQNAILGRTNRLVAKRATAIALTFEHTTRLPDGVGTVLTGLPVRAEIQAIADMPAPAKPHILVIGGSQGARILSDIVPDAIASLDDGVKAELKVTHQARPEDVDRVRETYAKSGVEAEVASYYTDLPTRLAGASLMVARAGASTIAELTVAGKASILVPLGIAMDDHQTANAKCLGGAATRVMPESEFTVERLAASLAEILSGNGELEAMGAAARAVAMPDAHERLANLIEEVAGLSAGQDKAA